jgi:hypothetical protein
MGSAVKRAGALDRLWYYLGMNNFPDRDFKCLPLYGDSSNAGRLFDKQRRELAVRGGYVRRVMADDSAKLDPVLRSHLGLDQKDVQSTSALSTKQP